MLLLHRATVLHDKRSNPVKFTSLQIEATHAAQEFLVSDMASCPTVKELSTKVLLNECILKKCFRHLYGKPIHQYFIEKRMKRAKKLLLDPQLPIDEISEMLGYPDKHNFYGGFKRYFNITPGQWCEENNINRKEVRQIIKKINAKK